MKSVRCLRKPQAALSPRVVFKIGRVAGLPGRGLLALGSRTDRAQQGLAPRGASPRGVQPPSRLQLHTFT